MPGNKLRVTDEVRPVNVAENSYLHPAENAAVQIGAQTV